MHLHETEWELNSFLNLICGRPILSGSYVSFILVLYVTDIFEWERDNILICGWHIVNGVVGISDHLNLSRMKLNMY